MTADTIARVNNRIDALSTLGQAKLKDQRRRTFKSEPPNWPPDLIRRAIANRWQEGVLEGIPLETREIIDRLVAERDNPRKRPIVNGTRFVRHWRGEDHNVLADANGFVYRSRTFKSLSAVARAITGQHLSGPTFFGAHDA